MASFTYTGSDIRQFPTLLLTLKPGDTFEAPDNFVAVHCALTKKPTPVAPSAPSDLTVGA